MFEIVKKKILFSSIVNASDHTKCQITEHTNHHTNIFK